jgi:hypothetical protein
MTGLPPLYSVVRTVPRSVTRRRTRPIDDAFFRVESYQLSGYCLGDNSASVSRPNQGIISRYLNDNNTGKMGDAAACRVGNICSSVENAVA